jgi:tetratricopeptide (TPR) repeat protein
MYKADPTSWRVHQVLCDSFEEADRLDDAAKECQTAIDMKPAEPGLHQQLGDVFWKQNHLEQAEAAFQAELKLNPQNPTAIYDLAVVEIERSKPDAAVPLLKQALGMHPESVEPRYQLARAEAQLGQTDAAIQDFEAVVKSSGPKGPETLRQSYYQLSQLYRRTKQPEQARLALDSFVRLKQQADAEQDQKLEDKLKRSSSMQSQ